MAETHGFSMLIEILIGIATFALQTLAINWMRPLGGLIYAGSALIPMVPVIGKLYKSLFIDLFPVSFIFKSISIGLSGSGAIILIVICQYHSPWVFLYSGFFFGVSLSCFFATLSIMHNIHLMEIPNFHATWPTAVKFMGRFALYKEINFTNISMMRLKRAHFTDMTIVNLIIILNCYGVMYFCFHRIGIIKTNESFDTAGEAVLATLTFLRFFTGKAFQLDGPWGLALGGFYGLALVFYTMFFISLASKLIDEQPDDVELPSKSSLDQLIHSLDAVVAASVAMPDETPPPNSGADDRRD